MRLKPEVRKEEILNAALKIASKSGGWSKLTRESVAKEADCSEALISLHFGTMVAFKRSVMRAAIKTENLTIVAQGLAVGDATARKADSAFKFKALSTLV